MRPERLSQGITLSRSRIVVVPSIRLLVPERDGAALFQRMLTDGSSAVVPESSMRVVFACAADAQIMVSARAKKKSAAAWHNGPRSWRTQRVEDSAAERARLRHDVVQIGERPAALVPGVAGHRAHVLRTAIDERAREERFSRIARAVAARGPGDFRK